MPGPPKPPPPPGRTPPPPPGSRERRAHTRYAVKVEATISHASATWTAPLVNISTGGVLVELLNLADPPQAGDDCSVFIRFQGAQVLITAKVVRIERGTPGRVAMEWASGDIAVIRQLAEVLERLRPDIV